MPTNRTKPMNHARAHRRLLPFLLVIAACSTNPPPGEAAAPTGITNYRDLEPALASSGQIEPDQMDALHAAGFAMFISLRAPGEEGTGWEEDHATHAGFLFARLPVTESGDLSRENAEILHDLLAGSGPDKRVLVYCRSGNRAGALLGLEKAWFEGMDRAEAVEYAKRAGATKWTGEVEERLAE